MASIYGFAELMLAQEFEPEEQREFLATIFRQSELMVSIINELLDLARIEARRGKDFNIQRIDLGELLREIVGGFKSPDGRPSPQPPTATDARWVRGDRKKLTQAIGNVLSNAYKYSPGGGSVSIEFPEVRRAGRRPRPRPGHRHDAGAAGPRVRTLLPRRQFGQDSRHRTGHEHRQGDRRTPWRPYRTRKQSRRRHHGDDLASVAAGGCDEAEPATTAQKEIS
jgi:hypothetical protein